MVSYIVHTYIRKVLRSGAWDGAYNGGEAGHGSVGKDDVTKN